MSLKPVPTVHLFWRPAVAFALTTLLFNPKAYAQSTGATLSGRITDQTGATVRASVFLKNNATGFERTVSSEANGLYTILSLDAGVYFIQVAAPGFGKVVQDSVKLDVGSYARRCKTRPQCAARAVLRGGVKAGHRRILVL